MTSTQQPPSAQVSVVGGFELRIDGEIVPLPHNAQRVIAFLAISNRPQRRSMIAARLWIDSTDERAAANLRTALWKARQVLGEYIDVAGTCIALSARIEVDLVRLIREARRLSDPDSVDAFAVDPIEFLGELLPEWDEEWVAFERNRLRQLSMHALESMCIRMCAMGRWGAAIDAGLAAVSIEPLRESAQRALIAAHIAEGNVSEAHRQYDAYCALLREHLGVGPSAGLRALVRLNGGAPSS